MEKKSLFGVRVLIPIITASIGIAFLTLGLTRYGFWHEMKGPLPGFFPTIVGIVLVAVSGLALFQSFKDPVNPIPLRNWMPAFGALGIILGTLVFGMLVSIIAFLIGWIRFYEKYDWKTTITTTLILVAIVVGVFMFWLQVPFPKGLILDALAY